MRVSLDLDGVVCDLTGTTLTLAHNLHRRGFLSDEEIEHIYLNARLLNHPSSYLAPGDEVVIITARMCAAHAWTRRWMKERGLGTVPIEFVSNEEIEELRGRGLPDEASEAAAKLKAQMILASGAEVHIDNNPVIVRVLRQRGITALCVRMR